MNTKNDTLTWTSGGSLKGLIDVGHFMRLFWYSEAIVFWNFMKRYELVDQHFFELIHAKLG